VRGSPPGRSSFSSAVPAPTAVTAAETPGPIQEGAPGAVTRAAVAEAPAPEAAPAASDDTLEERVERQLSEDPAVPDEGIEVDVESGVAQLSGTVPDEETAERVGDDAARIDGVIGLENELRPGGEPRTPEPEGEDRDAGGA
jgi:osmotically-inducible protein OsmY